MHKDDRSYAGPSRSSEAIMSTAPYASTSQTMSTKPPPPSSSLVGPRMSSASAEAKKLEEERRLMYVALTRAKDELAVVYPMQVYGTRRGSDYSIDQLSRFLDRGVRATMQRVVVEEPGEAPTPTSPTPVGPPIDLRAIMRGRFAR